MTKQEPNMHPKHDEDFYGWAMANASLLKQGKYQEVDMEHIIEELEEMGGSNETQLINRLAQLIFHLLKWEYQPDFRGRSWHGSIKEQRKRTRILIKKNPSLKSKVNDSLIDAYDIAFSLAEKETPIDLKLLPSECPYTFEQIMDEAFFPV
jgi:hypothetical protein